MTFEENMIESATEVKALDLSSEEQKNLVVEALEESKALDIQVLDVSDVASFTDFIIVATGTSNTHLSAVASNISREISRKGLKVIGEEGKGTNEWVLVDFGDVVVNVMRSEVRELYQLEKLWDREVRNALDSEEE